MWIAAIVFAVVMVGAGAFALRRRRRGRTGSGPGPQPWDETLRPSDDPYFESRQYISRY